jgi:hypothetical protein
MHIPKSAGSSVHAALEEALPRGAISPKRMDGTTLGGFIEYDSLDRGLRAALAIGDDEVAALSAYPVVSGHFSLSTLLRVTRASAVATVLREPRARALSHYAFLRLFPNRIPWRGRYPALSYALRTLDEYLTEPAIAAETDNLVCRMLLAEDPRIPKVGFIADSNLDAVALEAIGELEMLGYVGVLELGDSMWDGLSAFFGAPLTPTRVNKTESHRDIGDAPAAESVVTLQTLDALGARTAADAIVYRHALSTSGFPDGYVDGVQATAFAAELFRIGNLLGTSATEARKRGESSQELARQLVAKDEELRRAAALVQETRQQLAETNEELRLHRLWLEAVQGSASWRLTEPLRAGKRTFTRLPSSARRLARRVDGQA